jgi:hypothetical protein
MSKPNRLGRDPFERTSASRTAVPVAEGLIPDSVHRLVFEFPIHMLALTIKAVLLGRAILIRE